MARHERREAEMTPAARVMARHGGVAASPLCRPLGGLERSILAIAVTICLAACSRSGRGSSGPNVADVERQSEAEYDVARDLFLTRRDPRGALAHAQKAIELNEGNADAQHFVALVYLYFCSSSPLD